MGKKRYVSNKFNWNCIPARKKNKKGKAKESIIIAANKNLKEIEFRELSYRVAERLAYNRNRWRIITVCIART